MGHPNTTEMIAGLTFPQLKQLSAACEQRMGELRDSGVAELVDKFEAMASAEVGLSVEDVMKAMKKLKPKGRGRPRKTADADDGWNAA